MARRINVTETATAVGSTYSVTLGAHQDGNILFVCLTQDGGAATAIAPDATAVTAGWAMIGTQAAFADSKQAWAYKVVGIGEAPVANPTFTGANDDWIGTCIVVSEADTAGTILWQRSDWGGTGAGIATGSSNAIAASSAGGTTVITAPADALLLYSWSSDGGAFLRCKTDELIADSKVNNTGASHIIGHRQHGASGNPANVTVYSTELVEGGNGWVLAIPNATGGNLEKDCRSGITEVEWFGNFMATRGALVTISNATPAVVTYTAPTTDQFLDGQCVWFSSTGSLPTGITANKNYYITGLNTGTNTFNLSETLGGAPINTSSAGSGTHTATPGFGAANDIVASVNSISTLATVPGGGVSATFTAPATPWGRMSTLSIATSTAGAWAGGTRKIPATDMSDGIVAVQWMVDMAPTSARAGAEGAILLFSDGTNWAAFQLAPRSLYAQNTVQQAFIDLDNGTAYASSGTLDTTAITHVVPLYHRIGSSGSADAIFIKNLFVMRTATLTGGGEDFPLDFVALYDALNSWGSIDLASKQGSSQILGKAKIQIGDGTNKMYWDTSGAGFEFPVPFATTDNVSKNWNAATDSVSLTIKAASGNTVNLASGSITTSVPQSVTIDATSATTGISIAGQSFKGLSSFTDNAGVALTGPTYKECGTVTLKANMTNMSVSKTVGAVPAVAMTANNKVLTSCTIDPTGTSATYALELDAGVTAISLIDCQITAGSAEKVHVLATTGTVTITVSGTTTLIDTDVTTEGATVVIDAPQPTLDATVLANTRAVLWNRTTAAELDNTFVTGTTWSKTITSGASSGDVLDLYTFKEGYAEARSTIIYSGADATFAVEQAVDSSIDYYRTQESITDYTTLTEYNFYAPDIYIQADDADGENKLKRLFIFYNGALTTEDGARYMRGGITFNSPFDVVINRSVRAIAVDNVSATYGLHFTDEDVIRVTTDDGSSWIAPPSAPGSIRYAFGVSPGQIETGVSGVDAQDITDIANAAAAAVVADSKTLTVPKFLGLK